MLSIWSSFDSNVGLFSADNAGTMVHASHVLGDHLSRVAPKLTVFLLFFEALCCAALNSVHGISRCPEGADSSLMIVVEEPEITRRSCGSGLTYSNLRLVSIMACFPCRVRNPKRAGTSEFSMTGHVYVPMSSSGIPMGTVASMMTV